jgi:acetylornithine deacetylase
MPRPSPEAIDHLTTLIGFDTVSSRSNRALIDHVAGVLAAHGVACEVMESEDGAKANLYATIGPPDAGGLMLAGHTDVVPVEGQDWHTDPFAATEREGRIHGRGAADMKGFIACVLALVPELVSGKRGQPVHLAFTHDEEVGCFGGAELAKWLAAAPVRPACCVVGEPTGMGIVNGHKGKLSVDCRVRGAECHSAHLDRGVNAVELAAELIARLRAIQKRFIAEGPHDGRFDPPFTTVHTGTVHGGIARNIVPRDCRFAFEVRNLPGADPEAVLKEVRAFAEAELLPEMRAVAADAGIDFEAQSHIPALDPEEDSAFLRLALSLSGANAPGVVSFATESGLYQGTGIPTLVCGPGHIREAHRPDEYVELDQLALCESFLRKLVAGIGGPGGVR